MRTYAIGQPYGGESQRWAQSPHLTISRGVELAVFLSDPSDEERAAVTAGPADFAWVAGEHFALLAFQFAGPDGEPGIRWSDCPYTPHLATDAAPPDAAGTGRVQPVLVVLVDADDGRIAALRMLTWPSRFVDAVAVTVARLARNAVDVTVHDAALEGLYARYPRPEVLVRERADLMCIAGRCAPGQGPQAFGPETAGRAGPED